LFTANRRAKGGGCCKGIAGAEGTTGEAHGRGCNVGIVSRLVGKAERKKIIIKGGGARSGTRGLQNG